ncbi:histidinol-phosphate transaminase [Methylocystis sp. Sn-Cys]|uniref:histidinol-phosphate transaminase n=1 Tax=Methylocystis sp. Sn-Cys TaxID=1701263 RepID=UPI001922858F|nr:histidinol-phosphate transaminase [Methylocystis sp. Sn-Cys]MBL1258711.1 histidinol-phosphate transaminase [Methylocystis sp. Sn-Cys]
MTRPIPRPGVLDIDAYVPGKAGAPGAGRVFKLSANETPLGPSPAAVQALRDMAHQIAIYPEGSSAALREAVGARYGLDPARIIMGAGSDNILELLALAYIGPGDEGLYSQYGFLEYKIVTLAAGGVPVVAPETDYTANVDAILERVTQKTKIVFLANPNNPTGSYLPAAEVERLAKGLPARTLLVLDAAYAEYVTRADYEAGIALVDAHENVVMTRTFSKIYGLAGVRLGWGYGPAHVIDSLNRIRSPFNVSSAASIAGVAAVQDTAHVAAAVAHNQKWLPWLTREISSLGLEVLPSVGNFIAIRFPQTPGRTAADADRFLTARGLVLRAIGAYGMGEFLRLTIGSQEANEAVVAALGDFMSDRKAAANG